MPLTPTDPPEPSAPPSEPPAPAPPQAPAQAPEAPSAAPAAPVVTNPDADLHFQQGHDAYHNGTDFDANPHYRLIEPGKSIPHDHPARKWAEGYVHARKDAEPNAPETDLSDLFGQMDQGAPIEAQAIIASPGKASVEKVREVYARLARRRHVLLSEAARLEQAMGQLEKIAAQKAPQDAPREERVTSQGEKIVVEGFEG